jgi:predicted HTH transcriptional regulator
LTVCNRIKPKQKAIVEFIETNGPATPRQNRKLLGCDIREAYERLKRLGMAGIVENIGKSKHPEYPLVQR